MYQSPLPSGAGDKLANKGWTSQRSEQTALHDEVIFFDPNGFQPGLHDVLYGWGNKFISPMVIRAMKSAHDQMVHSFGQQSERRHPENLGGRTEAMILMPSGGG